MTDAEQMALDTACLWVWERYPAGPVADAHIATFLAGREQAIREVVAWLEAESTTAARLRNHRDAGVLLAAADEFRRGALTAQEETEAGKS